MIKKKKIIIAFIILHYMSAKLTRKCIDSIRGLAKHSKAGFKPICVVVDNNSQDNSLKVIKKIFKSCTNVYFIENEYNMGFSRANNIGYKFAKENFNPQHIVILNNDTEICQKDFLDKLDKIYQDSNAYVIGPDIFVKSKNLHQNPRSLSMFPKEKYLNDLDFLRCYIPTQISVSSRVKIYFRTLFCNFSFFRRYLDKKHFNKTSALWQKPVINPLLVGAALVFTDKFLKTNEEPFYPSTFLYYEEEILTLKCMKNNWKILYTPLLHVLHFDGVSTKQQIINSNERQVTKAKRFLESLNILLKYWDELERLKDKTK